MRTRSPTSSTSSSPPLWDACSARNAALPNRGTHQTASVVWAEPVTGSSGMATFGANTRDTTSKPSRSLRAVRITPRSARADTAPRSGMQERTSASAPASRRRSVRPYAAANTSTPRAAPISAVTSTGTSSSTGKSRVMSPFSPTVADSRPDRVWKPMVSVEPCSVARTCAVANVACPHRSTSDPGVNQRSSHSPATTVDGWQKAVSERFISRATSCIHSSSAGAFRMQTAAGLPLKGRSVKASTWTNSFGMSWNPVRQIGLKRRGYRRWDAPRGCRCPLSTPPGGPVAPPGGTGRPPRP